MRIFLSYGHDEHTAFALRLKSDLEQQGHEVWFDLDRLKPGGDWERYIEEGIERVSAENGKFLMLMTPHSARRPDGYCLNELARACSRRLTVIPLMVSTVEPPLSICRIQWLDFRDCVPAELHEIKYTVQFEKLLDAIKHNRLDFDGMQKRLQSVLQPIEYDEASFHLPRFTGREWVMKEVESWLDGNRRVLWITGKAGIGKSALASWLCDRRPEIAGSHYFRYGNANRSDRRALTSLAYQLATQLPDYMNRLNASVIDTISAETTVYGLFERLFIEPLSHGFPVPERSVVLLIDALDEATEKGVNELASLIGTEFNRTPKWLRLIVTSRPHETEINTALQSLDPWVLEAGCEANQEDIRTYLRLELRRFAGNGKPDEAVVEAIQEKSEGLFLYVWWVREELEAGRLSLTNIETFPRGLGGIYNEFFKRCFPDYGIYAERWRPVIEVICAARQPLPIEDLHSLFPAFYHPNEIVSGLGSLFPDSGKAVQPFHESVRDWIMQADRAGRYVVRVEHGQSRLAEKGWWQYESDQQDRLRERMSSYFVLHLPAHLSACHRDSDLAKLLLDVEWIQAKLEHSDVRALLSDYEYIKGDATCALVRGAIQRSAVVISMHPEELASQLAGRLVAHSADLTIRKVIQNVGIIAPSPWFRPLKPALNSPGTSLLCTLEGHSDDVRSVAVTPDSKRAVSASRDHTLKVWELETGFELYTLEGHFSPVLDVAVTPDGKRAVSASEDFTLIVWGMDTGHAVRKLEGHHRAVYRVVVTPDGKYVVSASRDHTLKVWDLETGQARCMLEGHSEYVWTVAVTPDSKRAVSASRDHTLKVWDLETGHVLHTLEGHSDSVWDLIVTPDGKRAVSASDDKTLKVWELDTGSMLCTMEGHSGGVIGVELTPDGKRAVSASRDHTLKVWDLETGQVLRTFEGHSHGVSSVDVTPDGKRAISASQDHTLKVWDLETGHVIQTLEGHSDSVWCVAVKPCGRYAVSASWDRTLKMWYLETGLLISTFHCDFPAVCCAFIDEQRIVAGDEGGRLYILSLEEPGAVDRRRNKMSDAPASRLI